MNNNFPYDDEIMRYDYNTHRYVLTEQGVLSELGENLDLILNDTGDANPSTLASRFLRRVSQVVYGYFYRDSMNEIQIEYLLAKNPTLRAWIKEALLAQTLYMLTNGDIALMSGVNVAKGQAMEAYKLRGIMRIAPEVEDIGKRIVPTIGVCLKYRGAMPMLVPQNQYRVGY